MVSFKPGMEKYESNTLKITLPVSQLVILVKSFTYTERELCSLLLSSFSLFCSDVVDNFAFFLFNKYMQIQVFSPFHETNLFTFHKSLIWSLIKKEGVLKTKIAYGLDQNSLLHD